MDLKELIDDYLEGKLSPKDRRLLEDLIAENPQYRAELAEQENGRAAMKLVDERAHQSSLKSWGISTLIAVLFVSVGYFLWATLGMSPGEKLYAKYYDTPPRQALKSALSGNESKLISEALKAYDKRDFKKAAALFEQVHPRTDSDYVLMYFGICQLELGRPEKAIPLLNLVNERSNTASKEVASWYEALGYFKLSMLEKGEIPLKITAASSNPFQDDAKKILESLR